MITKTRIAVVAAVFVGSASAALADSQFDVNIYRPAIQHSPMDAYAQSPSRTWGNGSTGTVKSYSSEEQRWFEKAQGPL
jgi:hypothetical protein